MARKPNTTKRGNGFSELRIKAVWEKARIVAGRNPNIFRKDHCGAPIRYKDYGITTPEGTGWEIDHIKPVSKNGGDELDNLQPLQWQNNREKADQYPALNYCKIKA
jgi:5-methylcytosine-specific restriction endonuclease McrA